MTNDESPHKLPPNRQRQQRRKGANIFSKIIQSSPQTASGLRYSTFCKVAVVKLWTIACVKVIWSVLEVGFFLTSSSLDSQIVKLVAIGLSFEQVWKMVACK